MAIACAPRRFGDRNFVGDPTASAVIIAPGEEVSRPRFHGTFATHGARHSPPGHVTDGAADAAAAACYTQVRRALAPLGVNPALRLGRARLNQRPAACN